MEPTGLPTFRLAQNILSGIDSPIMDVWTHQSMPKKSLPAQLLEQPYVHCEIQILESIQKLKLVRAWEVQSDFEIADYVNPAWDEGINCNLYASAEIEEKVMTRMRELAPDFACPSSGNACRWATVRYEPFAQQVIHPACRSYRDLL